MLSARVGSAEVITLKCDGSSGRNDEMVVPHRPRCYRISTLAFKNVTKIKIVVSPAANCRHVELGIFGSSQTRTPGEKDHEIKARFNPEEEKWSFVWTFDPDQGKHDEEEDGQDGAAAADIDDVDAAIISAQGAQHDHHHVTRSTGFFYIMVSTRESGVFYEINSLSKVVRTNQKIKHKVQKKRLQRLDAS